MEKILIFIWQLFFPKKKKPEPIYVKQRPKPEPELSLEDWSGNDYIFDKPKGSRHTVIRAKGKTHNLKKIYDRVNKEHFGGKIKAKTTWGRYGCRNVQREKSITFGTYSFYEQLIRIHPALDSEVVPELFVEHVIHHEILHEIYPPIPGGGSKWQIHHYAFRVAEAATPTYKEAMVWKNKNIKIFFREPSTNNK